MGTISQENLSVCHPHRILYGRKVDTCGIMRHFRLMLWTEGGKKGGRLGCGTLHRAPRKKFFVTRIMLTRGI